MAGVLRSAIALVLLTPLCAHAGPLVADADLEKRGARIGNIDIEVDDVFENTTHLAAPYRLANNLHISTHDSTVSQQLLFHSGDAYNRRVLDETARMLRAQRYLNAATVEPVRYNEADNTVDVLVRVHDVWTLSPGVSFGRKGGTNSTRVKFSDMNFLGLGKQLALERSSNVDRSAWELSYTDPNVLGSWWQLGAGYSSLSDGSEKRLSLERPFYAMDSRWSAGFSGDDATTDVSRYSLGHVVDKLQMQERKFEIGGGFSEGLHDGWTTRYLGGMRYDARDFQTLANAPDAAIPDDRVVAYPWVGIEVMEDEFVATRNLDQIGRTEDLYLGLTARLEAGFESTALGSTRDGAIVNGKLQAGADLGHEQYLIHSLGFGTRIEGGALANASLDWSSRYYLRQSEHRVLFAALGGTVTSHRDPEEQLLLGGDNGLRGYPLRYQAGDQSALVTLEQRFYTDWQPLKLFNVGAAVFVDSGRTWGHDEFAAPPAGWLTDVGIGLRLGSARSGLGNVLHIDLAFPLNRTSDIDSLQLLVETKRSF
jgi:outer membrane protein assembly factor BamA